MGHMETTRDLLGLPERNPFVASTNQTAQSVLDETRNANQTVRYDRELSPEGKAKRLSAIREAAHTELKRIYDRATEGLRQGLSSQNKRMRPWTPEMTGYTPEQIGVWTPRVLAKFDGLDALQAPLRLLADARKGNALSVWVIGTMPFDLRPAGVTQETIEEARDLLAEHTDPKGFAELKAVRKQLTQIEGWSNMAGKAVDKITGSGTDRVSP